MKTWKLADIWTFLKNSIAVILKGEFLHRLNVGQYFVHIVFTFFLFVVVIWISIMVETTMAKVERNKQTLKELEIAHSQKTFEVVSLSRRSEVDRMLKDMGSKVTEAEKPATILE